MCCFFIDVSFFAVVEFLCRALSRVIVHCCASSSSYVLIPHHRCCMSSLCIVIIVVAAHRHALAQTAAPKCPAPSLSHWLSVDFKTDEQSLRVVNMVLTVRGSQGNSWKNQMVRLSQGKSKYYGATVNKDAEKILNCCTPTVYNSSKFFCLLRLQIICISTFKFVPLPLFLL